MKLKLKKLNSRGFGHVEMFLVVAAFVFIGAAGLYVNNNNKSHAQSVGAISVGVTGTAEVVACIQNNVVYAEVYSWIGNLPSSATIDMFDEASPYSTLRWIAIGPFRQWVSHGVNLSVNNYLAWSVNGAHITGFTRAGALQQCSNPPQTTPVLE